LDGAVVAMKYGGYLSATSEGVEGYCQAAFRLRNDRSVNRAAIFKRLLASTAAATHNAIRALVIMSTWAWPLPPAEFHKRIFPWRMMHAPVVGPYLLGRHNALAGRGMYLSVVDRKKFRDVAQSTYESVLPDPGSRLLTWTWPRWIPIDDTARGLQRFEWLERELRKSKFPTLLVWGREDEVFDYKTFARRFKELLPHAEGPELVTGRHFLQEDSGAEIADKINRFLGRVEGKQS
jgi:pimeloyl-ACP methyl ester carboxylesterase